MKSRFPTNQELRAENAALRRKILEMDRSEASLKRSEEAVRRLSRQLRAISKCGQTLLQAVDEQALLNDICLIVCEEAGYRMAWVGYAEHDEAKTVRPVARAGVESGYLAEAHITWADTERGHGPTGMAVQTGETVYIQDFTADPRTGPWRTSALRRGYRCSIALPLKNEKRSTFGVLNIYSAEPNAFTPEEIQLLEALAGDLAFGITALRNRTGRKQAVDALRDSEQSLQAERDKLRIISENAPFGMFLMNREGRFTYTNPKFTELFGYEPSDIPDGRTWLKKAYPDDNYRHTVISAWKEDWLSGKPGERQLRVFTVTCKDGTEKIVHFITSALVSGGYLIACEDITELKRLESQLLQSQKMEAIGTLAGGIAHDFNNILAGIIGFTEMVLDDMAPDSGEHRRLGLVLKGAQRGRDLVRQILTFSRQNQHEQEPVALSRIVEEGLKLLRPVLPATTEIRSRILTGDDIVLADPGQIHQVLMNLCTNSAQAMKKQGGVVEISVTRDHFEKGGNTPPPGMKPGDYVTLTVRDTGSGMKAEVLERIFDPFFTTKAHRGGTGLGLSVVHGIVKSHGGFIRVESGPGKGSVFSVYLPATRERQRLAAGEELPAKGGKESILFIDDEDILVELNRERLTQLGYEVVATTSGLEALEIFRKEPLKFNVVITDYTMPDITGLDLARKILKMRKDIPIILCTGYNDDISPDKAKKAGIREFLFKPQGKRGLNQAIRRVLDTKPVRD